MARKTWLLGLLLIGLLNTGCCRWCDRWCGGGSQRGYAAAPVSYAPQQQCVPCVPCCPVGSSPAPTQQWQRGPYNCP